MEILIKNIVKEYVKVHNLPSQYKPTASSPYETFMETFCTRILGIFPVHFQANEEKRSLTITSFLPIHAIVEQCGECSNLVDHLNFDRDNYSFYISISDTGGEISYSTKCDFQNTELTVDSVHDGVVENLNVLELWLPVFALVMFAGMSAEEVLSLVPLPELWDSRFWFFGIVECHARPD
jgi:hypothetical protein